MVVEWAWCSGCGKSCWVTAKAGYDLCISCKLWWRENVPAWWKMGEENDNKQ